MLPYINYPFAFVAHYLGSSVDELKLIFTLLASYPLAGLLKRIPDNRPDLKNLYIISIAIFYLVGLFDLWIGAGILIIDSVVPYLIAKYVQGPYMPWVAFTFLMGHMSISHIQRHIVNDPGVVDVTGAQMVLVMKLSAFCWNVHDGQLPEKDLEGFQKDHALRELPSLLDYAGYIAFFPSLFAGPAFDYVDYRRWLDSSMFALPPGTDPSKAPPTRKKRKIPRSGTPAAIKAVVGLAWIFAFLQFSGWYTPELILGDTYMTYSLPRRVFQLYALGLTTRMKYYGVWYLAEGACILSGIGYNGIDPKTGRADWSRLQNVDPLGVELAQNTRAYLGNWNMNTNNWLRNCMYLRVTPKGKKPGFRASMATFVTSAFWHGFEPGYYLAFVLAAFLQTIAKNCRRYIRPLFLSPTSTPLPSKRYYDIASWFITQTIFAFTVAPFILLSWSACMTAWSRVYFYAIFGVAASFAVFSAPGKAFLKRQLVRQNGPAAAEVKQSAQSQSSQMQKQTQKLDPEAEQAIRRTLDNLSSGLLSDRPGHPTQVDESDHHRAGHLGLPEDPEGDLDELMAEVRREVAMRRERGMSLGQGFQDVVQAKLASFKAGAGEEGKIGGGGGSGSGRGASGGPEVVS